MKNFIESEHPRDSDGKFTVKEYSKMSTNELKTIAQMEYRSNIPYEENVLGSLREKEQETQQNAVEMIYGKEYKGYKGQLAVEKLLKEKQGHIKNAFYREDIGGIDLIWGNDYMGLQHIIERRAEQGIDVQSFLNDITDVIQTGNFRKKNSRGNFEFISNGKIAVIAPEFKGHKITFLLTAFKTHSKK